MKLFLDTEFADLECAELVSLALVSKDGKHEFYADRDPLPAEATNFVRQNAYPLPKRGSAALEDAMLTRQLLAFASTVLPDQPKQGTGSACHARSVGFAFTRHHVRVLPFCEGKPRSDKSRR